MPRVVEALNAQMRLLPAVLLALAALAPPAGAWTRPREVARYNEIESVRMFHGPGDAGALAWERGGDAWGFAPLGPNARPGAALRSRRLAGVAPAGAGRWLWLDLDSFAGLDAECGCGIPAAWSIGPAGSLRPGAAQPLAKALPYLDIAPKLAADQEGNALIAWVQEGREDHYRLLVALRRAGRPFGRPRAVLTGDLTSVEVAMGEGGRFVIGVAGFPRKPPGVELPSDRVEVLRGDVAAGVKHRDRLDASADFLALDASVAADGSVALAWWSDLAANADGSGNLFAATGTASGPLTLDTLARTETAVADHERPAALAEPGARALVMWRDLDAEKAPVMLNESDGSGHLARARALAACGETGDLARRADGRVLAAWTTCAGDGDVRAQSRAPRGRWGRVRTLHRGEDRNVAASFEPRSGRPVVAFVNYDFDRPHGPDALMVSAGDLRPIR
jgi:hypothetical protein